MLFCTRKHNKLNCLHVPTTIGTWAERGRNGPERGTRNDHPTLALFWQSCLFDDVADLGGKGRHVKGDAVFDGPFNAATADHFAVADLIGAGWIKDLEILERITIDDDQVGLEPDANAPKHILLAQNLSAVAPSRVELPSADENLLPGEVPIRGSAQIRKADR